MRVIEAQRSWSWRLTITPHINQMRTAQSTLSRASPKTYASLLGVGQICWPQYRAIGKELREPPWPLPSQRTRSSGSLAGSCASPVVAGLAATLFSVMFVTLQVRWRLWARSGLRRAVATSALGELMIPLFVSAVTLMAGNPWRIAAWISGCSGWPPSSCGTGGRTFWSSIEPSRTDRWQAWGAWWSVRPIT